MPVEREALFNAEQERGRLLEKITLLAKEHDVRLWHCLFSHPPRWSFFVNFAAIRQEET